MNWDRVRGPFAPDWNKPRLWRRMSLLKWILWMLMAPVMFTVWVLTGARRSSL
jgi:hypothetical protein